MVGISTYLDRARWDIWDLPAALVPLPYVTAVSEAGATPVLLPPTAGVDGGAARLDGLVLTAGPDIDPSLYGSYPHREAELRPGRDEPELSLLAAARRADLPVLGICRGMQLMALAYEGCLFQHLPEALGHDLHCPRPGTIGRHRVSMVPGYRVGAALGPGREVTSHHHQGVMDAGGLAVTARAEDGLPEALEDPELTFMVGVQWHPELEHPELFEAFVGACRARAAAAGSVIGNA